MTRSRFLSVSALACLALLLVCLSAAPADLDPQRAALRAEVQRLKPIQARYEEALLRLPGVFGLGIGLDSAREHAVFLVIVADTGPLPSIPAVIEGAAVRVERRPPIRLQDGAPGCTAPCHANLQPAAVQMGNSGGWENGGACTLGFKACDLGTGKMVFVTASHCNTFSTCSLPELGNLDWLHPGPLDDPADSGYDIGDISGHAAPSCGSNNNLTDVTKVASPGSLTSIAVRDVGFLYAAPGDPLMGDPVQKSGRTTGWTTGEIDAVNMTINPPADAFCCGALTMKQQIIWHGDAGANDFGDSGSALLSVEAEPRVLGLHWAGDGVTGYANHIDNVLAALDLSLNLISCVQDCLFSRAAQGAPGEAGLIELGHRFRDQVLQRSAEGRRMTQAFYQFSDEAVLLALRSPALLSGTRRALLDYAPVLQGLVVNGKAQVRAADLDRVDRLLGDYTVGASPAMRQEIQWLRSQIRDPRVQAALGVKVVP